MSHAHLTVTPWPTNIRLLKKERILEVEFDDGTLFRLTAEYLRVESPSAEVQGHGSSQKKIISGCQNVAINQIESVGNYAIRIHFNDNHSTGIYTWAYLYDLGRKNSENWARYLVMLKSMGLAR